MGLHGGKQCNQLRLHFVFLGLVLCYHATIQTLQAQVQPGPTAPRPQITTPNPTTGESPFQRQTVPGAAKISPAPDQLSLSTAIELAISNNLATLLAQEERREASGIT